MYEVNLSYIKDLEIRPESIKYMEKNKGKFSRILTSKMFSMVQSLFCKDNRNMNKCDYIKIRKFYMPKETLDIIKKDILLKIFVHRRSDERFLSKIYKILTNLSKEI